MTEDRFLTFEVMLAVSKDLEEAGFKHVQCQHMIDPEWRREYRGKRPELEGVAWTIHLSNLYPLPMIKKLIEICERHGLTFWLNSLADEGTELYLRVGEDIP